MIKVYCPKCGKEAQNNEIRCSHCGMRLRTVCRACGALNGFGNENCSVCGEILIRYCKECGAANLPDAIVCRKCDTPLKKVVLGGLKNGECLEKTVSAVLSEPEDLTVNQTNESLDFTEVSSDDLKSEIGTNNQFLQSENVASAVLNPEKQELSPFDEVSQENDVFSEELPDIKVSDNEVFEKSLLEENLDEALPDEVALIDEPLSTDISENNINEIEPIKNSVEDTQKTDDTVLTELETINEPFEILDESDGFSADLTEIPAESVDNLEEHVLISDEPLSMPDKLLEISEETAQISDEPIQAADDSLEISDESDLILNESVEPINEPQTVHYEQNHIPDVPTEIVDESIEQTSVLGRYSEKQADNQQEPTTPEDEDDQIIFMDDGDQIPDNSSKNEKKSDNDTKEADKDSVKEPDFSVGKKHKSGFKADKIFDFSEAQDLLDKVVSLVEQSDKRVIAICGEDGMGKTTVVNTLINSLSQKHILSLYSECSELTKIAPFGAIRDSLLRLLSLPDFHPDMQSFFGEQSKKLFDSNFPGLTAQEVMDFMNFLYPSASGEYKDLYKNKQQTYRLLENILKSITSNNNIILIIDNYNMIDSSSYEFINSLIGKNIINDRLKLIVTYQEHKSAKYYFDERFINSGIFATLSILNMNEIQTKKMVQNFVNTDKIPEEVLKVINDNGRGNVFFAEQYLALLFDAGYIAMDKNSMAFSSEVQIPYMPNNLEEVVNARLNLLQFDGLKESLYSASILGYKFDKNILATVMGYTVEQTDEILGKLSELLYIQKSTNYEYTFKNMTLWNVVYDEAQKSAGYSDLCRKIYTSFGKHGLSNITVKAAMAKQCGDTELAAQAWKHASDKAVYLGDEYIYTLCIDEWLNASGYSENSEQVTDVQLKVLETLGKIYSFDKPEVAVKYLVKPILFAQKQKNIPKMLELSAFMVRACDALNNFNGIIETIDMALAKETTIKPIQKALICSRKMPALFALGNCEEAINLANNDLLPVIYDELRNSDGQQRDELFDVWFDVSVHLANTYSLQGNNQSFAVIKKIEEAMQLNTPQDKHLIQLTLAKAFANVILGNVNECYNELNSLSEFNYQDDKLYQSQYNIILSLAKIISGQSDSLKQKLFKYTMYSDDNSDIFGKHFFKLIFARFLYLSGDYVKSIQIFNDELNFFAQEKIVTGALICWLFIASINLKTGSINSAEDVAMKALEVAQNPKFSQHHTAIHLQRILAEINMKKEDFEAAKMYIEQGMYIAKQFGLEIETVELSTLYIKLLRHLMLNSDVDASETANKINYFYQIAMMSLQKIQLTNILKDIQNEYSAFLQYCKNNSIKLS